MNGLDLYAKIEYLFDFDEVIEYLWSSYIQELKRVGAKRVLDIGCGSGGFMEMAQKEGIEIVGVDISSQMVKNAKERGLEAYCVDICEFDGEFDVAVAIFDVVNYMDKEYLKKFLSCVENRLKSGGYFLFDINTLFGFEEVGQGTLAKEDDDNYVILNSIYVNGVMRTNIDLFRKRESCYKKESGKIIQHFHSIEELEDSTSMKLVDKKDIHLYGYEEADKNLLIFQK